MRTRYIFNLPGLIIGVMVVVFTASAGQTQAPDGGQNPTPIVITVTPLVSPTPWGSPTPEVSATSEQPTAVPSATGDGSLLPDRFEPNDDLNMAAPVNFGLETGLTLIGPDRDYFTGYLKTGQMVRVDTFVYGGLDTGLKLYWTGQLVAENDDRAPADMGSTVTFTAPADGWYGVLVEKTTVYDGVYDLEMALTQPTTTPTAAPTGTPTPTVLPSATPTPRPSPTPLIQPDLAEPNDIPEMARPVTPGLRATYTVGAGDVDHFTFIAKAGSHYACETVTGQVDTLLTVTGVSAIIGINDDRGVGRVDSYLAWTAAAEQPVIVKVEARGGSFGQYEFVCQHVTPPPAPPAVSAPAPLSITPVASLSLTGTTGMTLTAPPSLTVHYIGRAPAATAVPITHVRLLIYYDANNDRQPGPGEGVANVSVLAVSAQGQRLARVFTNAQGEAIFNLNSAALARVIVPFVPGWSARVRVGEANNDIVLGLPAVRLPVFLPVRHRVEER
ncbi:MAG: hypothetical protein KJ069_23145 [Anaerolineae bacterium]|nr:hypothetical protein [Anaerolineae bacterium]